MSRGASHAADGYARSTRKVGVCFANVWTGSDESCDGIATAYMDSVPIVAITCNVNVPLLGKDSFQEIDIAGITTPIHKAQFYRKGCHKACGHDPQSIPDRTEGASGPGARRYPEGYYGGKDGV